MVDLMARPEYFDGKKVKVSGFFHVQQESTALFLTKDLCDHNMSECSIRLAFKNKVKICDTRDELDASTFVNRYNGKYMMFMDVFDKNRYGDGGSLKEIELACERKKLF